jgi:uncharacterized protein (TIGR02001 family)
MRAKLILSLLLAASANSCLFAETRATHQTSNQSVILASDYLSDGVSQTDRNPALQWQREDRWQIKEFASPIYSRLFASNLEYANDTGLELDLGLGTEVILSGMKWDFGLLNNFNLGLDDVDSYFLEVYAGLYLTDNASIYFTYADDSETFDGGNNAKIHWEQSFQIDRALTWSYQIGYTDMYRSRLSNSDYIWWKAAIQYDFGQSQLSLEYHDTDIQKPVDFNDIAQESLVVSFTYNL